MVLRILCLFLLTCNVYANIPSEAIRTTDKLSICTTKTSTIRNVPEKVKKAVYARQGIKANHKGSCEGNRGCELDHRISLDVGGSNNISNLIVKPYFGECNMQQKDALENKLHKLICKDLINVDIAQDYLFNDWETAYKLYVDNAGCDPLILAKK